MSAAFFESVGLAQALQGEFRMREEVERVRRNINSAIERYQANVQILTDEMRVERSGYVALFARKPGGGFECLAVVDAAKPPADLPDTWDVLLPILVPAAGKGAA